MANGYNQQFTLIDIFNNKKLAKKLPLVRYKENVGEDNKVHKTTNMKSVGRLVYETAKSSAKPYYNPFISSKNGNLIIVGGKLTGDYETAYESVYNGIVAQKEMLSFTANNGDIIRNALKESQMIKRQTGQEPKLWLKAGSMLEIENMSKKQIRELVDDVMKNIYYSDNYMNTQKKYDVAKIIVNGSTNYERRKLLWQHKVGDL